VLSLAATGAMLALLLPFMLEGPARVEARRSPYEQATFDYEVTGPLASADVERIGRIARPGSVALFLLVSGVTFTRNDSKSPYVDLYLTSDVEAIDRSWFSDRAVVGSSSPRQPWIDLTSDLARALDAGPGDTVRFTIRGRSHAVTVRRLLALNLRGVPGAAVMATPSPDLFVRASPDRDLEGTIGVFETDEPADRVRQELKPLLDRVQLLSRRQILDRIENSGSRSSWTSAFVLLLVLAGSAGVAVREAVVMAADRRRSVVAMTVLGTSRRAIVVSSVCTTALGAGALLLACPVVIREIVYPKLVGSDLPPSLRSWVSLTVAAGLAVYLLTSMVLIGRASNPRRALAAVMRDAGV
jgi:hypothetical protein